MIHVYDPRFPQIIAYKLRREVDRVERRMDLLERVRVAAEAVEGHITSKGLLEHHGHNGYPRPSACHECTLLNNLRDALTVAQLLILSEERDRVQASTPAQERAQAAPPKEHRIVIVDTDGRQIPARNWTEVLAWERAHGKAENPSICKGEPKCLANRIDPTACECAPPSPATPKPNKKKRAAEANKRQGRKRAR